MPPLPAGAFERWRGTRPARPPHRARAADRYGLGMRPSSGRSSSCIDERARWLLDITAAKAKMRTEQP